MNAEVKFKLAEQYQSNGEYYFFDFEKSIKLLTVGIHRDDVHFRD